VHVCACRICISAAATMVIAPKVSQTMTPCCWIACGAGSGEFGEVYRAKWHGSYVAAKVLKRSDEIALGDFRTEIAILRKIHHPNCVQVGIIWGVPMRPLLLLPTY
jgi:Protein kinase domain